MITVSITYGHIEKGRQGKCDSCPAAIAIREALAVPENTIIRVLGYYVQIGDIHVELPADVVTFQTDFDSDRREVGPLTFGLPVSTDGSPDLAHCYLSLSGRYRRGLIPTEAA